MSVEEAVLETVQVLSPERKQKLLEYAQALKQEQSLAEAPMNKGSWHDSPAIGMWKDREDMKDSVEWVRQMRKKHWRQP